MKKILSYSLVIALFSIVLFSCSSSQYYVFKTIKHNAVNQDVAKSEPVEQASSETQVNEVVVTEMVSQTAQEEIVTASSEKTFVAPKTKVRNITSATTAANVKDVVSIAKENKQQIKAAKKIIKKNKLEKNAAKPLGEPKSQLVALLLVFFIGGIGIHRFYLGYTTIGIIQLLTLGGCGIWALIDLIRIALGDLKPADGSEYNPKL